MGMDPDVINFDELPTDKPMQKQAAPQGAPDVISFDELPGSEPVAQQTVPTSGVWRGIGNSIVRGYQNQGAESGLAERFELRSYKASIDNGGDIKPFDELMMSNAATPAQVELWKRRVPQTDPVWRAAELDRVNGQIAKLDQSIIDAEKTREAYPAQSRDYQRLQAGIQQAKGNESMLGKVGGVFKAAYDNPMGVPELFAEGGYSTARPIAGAMLSAYAARKGQLGKVVEKAAPIAAAVGITGFDSYKSQISSIIEEKAKEGGFDLRKEPAAIDKLLEDVDFVDAVKSEAFRGGVNDAGWAAFSIWLGINPKIKGLWQPVVQTAAEMGTETSKQLFTKGKVYDPTNIGVAGITAGPFEGISHMIGHSAGVYGEDPAKKPAAKTQAQEQTATPHPAAEATAQTQQAAVAPEAINVDDLPEAPRSVAGETQATPPPEAPVKPTPVGQTPEWLKAAEPVDQTEANTPAPVQPQAEPVAPVAEQPAQPVAEAPVAPEPKATPAPVAEPVATAQPEAKPAAPESPTTTSARERLAKLEAAGKGDSKQAEKLRRTIERETPAAGMTVEIMGKKYPVSSMQDASAKWLSATKQIEDSGVSLNRDTGLQKDLWAGDGPVVRDANGKIVGYIAQNGSIKNNRNVVSERNNLYVPTDADYDAAGYPRQEQATKPSGEEPAEVKASRKVIENPKSIDELNNAWDTVFKYEKKGKYAIEEKAAQPNLRKDAENTAPQSPQAEAPAAEAPKNVDTPPELIHPDDFSEHELARKKYVEEMGKLDAKGVSSPPKEMMLKAATRVAHKEAIAEAIKEGKPVSADAVETYGIKIPKEYFKEGDRYTKAAEAPKASEPAPAVEAPKPTEPVAEAPKQEAPARNIDAEYEAAVATKKLANIDPLVKEEATRQGFTVGPVYHGTPTGGFNKFDPSRTGSNAGVSRGGPSFTTNLEAAEAYSETMRPEDRAIAELVAKSNEIFATIPKNAPGEVYEGTPVGEIRFDANALDSLSDGISGLEGHADELLKAGYPEVAAKLKALAKEDFEGGKPEVKAVFLRLSGEPREITTTRAKMAEDLQGVRATENSPVVVNLEDGEKIYYIGNPKDIKSAEAIARTDAGEIVPLSRRFQESEDIRGALDNAVVKTAEKGNTSEEGIVAALDKAAKEALDPKNLNEGLSSMPKLAAALTWVTAREIQRGLTNFSKWASETAKKFPMLKDRLKDIWADSQRISKNPIDYLTFRAMDNVASKVWQNVRRNKQSKTLRELANVVFAKGGPDADAVENSIPYRVDLTRKQYSNIYAEIINRFAADFAGMTKEQLQNWDTDFRDYVLGNKQPTDMKMARAVKDYRGLMRDMLSYQRDGGVTVGDAGEKYFARHWDPEAVEANRDDFVNNVAVEMYRRREARLLKEAIDGINGQQDKRAAERKAADKKFDRKIKTDAEYEAEAAEWAQEKVAALEAEHAAKDDAYYKQKAEDWATSITHGDVLGLTLFKNTDGKVRSDSTEARTFTDEEAAIGDKYLKKNLDEITLGYIDGAVRGTELARVFGEDGKKFESMMNRLSAEGVGKDTILETRDLVAQALGVGRNQLSQSESVFFDWANVVLAAAFLGKTSIYNLTVEPMSFGIRTGNAYLALKGVAETWKNTIHEIGRPSSEMVQRIREKFGDKLKFEESVNGAVTEQLGLVQKEIERAYMNMNVNSHWDYSAGEKGSKWAKWLSNRIYRANLMMATEHAKVQASVAISRLALRDNARFMRNEAPLQKVFSKLGLDTRADKSVATIFNENGVPEADHKAFADWVVALDGKTDAEWENAVMDPSDPMAKNYRRALQRMSLGMSVQTNAALKLSSSDHWFGRLMMQLMNYSYAYGSIVKDRMYAMAKGVASKDASTIDRLRYAAPLMVGAPLAVLGAFAAKELSKAIWPSDDAEEALSKQSDTLKGFNLLSFAGMFGAKIEFLTKGFLRGQPPGGATGEVIFKGGAAALSSAADPDNAKKQYSLKKTVYNTAGKTAATGTASAVHPFFGFIANAAVNDQDVRKDVIGEDPKKKKK